MAYYIQKPSLVDSNVTVYYAGGRRWTDDPSEKALFVSESAATDIMVNSDGRNGGWSNATVVSE